MSLSRVLWACLCLSLTVSAFAALQLPPNQTVEATGSGGAVVNYNAGATGSGDDENGRPIDSATCSPASGSQFALGKTTVNCIGSNGGSGSFEVNVVDTTAPALALPRDFTVPASSASGATVTFNATASDVVDGSVGVSCAPASGSHFAVGPTTVLCTATDSHQNASSGAFTVTVTAQPPPPPDPHDDIVKEATGPNGAVVTYSAGGSGTGDDENGRPLGSCSPASGSTFPLGETTVQCTGGVTFKVTIVDTTAPALMLPGDITKQTSDANGTTVDYTASADDLVDGSVAVTCTPPSGSNFAVGTTVVQCSASDTRGNSANGTFNVTVEQTANPDTEAPTIVSIVATPDTITPPNKRMQEVVLTVEVHDNMDPAPIVRIFDVTSNEAIGEDDWEITGLLTVDLAADRDPHGSARIYTVHVEAIDAAGNRSVGAVDVTVPHDSGNSQPVTAVPGREGGTLGSSG